MLGMVPPDPFGVSPPFPMSKLTRSRPLLGGTAKAGGGLVDVPPQKGIITVMKQRKIPVVTPIYSVVEGGAKRCWVGQKQINRSHELTRTKLGPMKAGCMIWGDSR